MQWGGGSKVTKAYLLEMFQNSHHFWGAEGGSKITKAHLSEMFRNSIIRKGSVWFFHVGWGLRCSIYAITSVILGVQWGGGVK